MWKWAEFSFGIWQKYEEIDLHNVKRLDKRWKKTENTLIVGRKKLLG